MRLQRLLDVTKQGHVVVFMDECVYTQRSLIKTVWKKPSMSDFFPKTRLGFDAIAVLGVIDLKGQLRVLITQPKSIGVPNLIEMSNQLKKIYKRKKVYIFLDNLAIHRNPDFKSTLLRNG